MKQITAAFWACLVGLILFSCKKNDVQPDTEVPTPVGVPTEIGTPDGSPAAQKSIDAAGGTISSNDGRIKIIVPAGALSTSQQVSIQSISNENPLAIKQAYRLLPHGVQFSKPVTIEFSYNDEDVKNTIPEALGIAYQDDKGIWQAQGGAVLNKSAKTITITTTHFSDWSLFESFYLTASGKGPVNPLPYVKHSPKVLTQKTLTKKKVSGKKKPAQKKKRRR